MSGAGGYNWELSRSSDFGTVIERNLVLLVGAETTDDTISGIPPGTYFWRVQAVSPDLEPGAWSAARSVVVTGAGPGVPAAPTLNPPDGSGQYHPLETITFSWTAVPGAVSYILQESTDPSFPVGTRVRQVDLQGTTEGISLGGGHIRQLPGPGPRGECGRAGGTALEPRQLQRQRHQPVPRGAHAWSVPATGPRSSCR